METTRRRGETRGAGRVAALALAALLAGCGEACEGGGSGGSQAEDPPFTIREVRGVIRLAPRAPLPIAAPAPLGGSHCDAGDDRSPIPPQVDPTTRALAECVVWLVGVPEGAAPAPTPRPVHLDQRGCEFTPRAQVVALGSTLRIASSDPTLHNVHGRLLDGRNVFNVGMAPGTPPLSLVLNHGGPIRVGCDVHAWMGAWILVVGHRFAALTNRAGRFAFPAPPSGSYELRLWHPQIGQRALELQVGDGPQDVSFDGVLPGPTQEPGGLPPPAGGAPSTHRIPSGGR